MGRTKTAQSRPARRRVGRRPRASAPVGSTPATSGPAPGMQALNAYLAVADVSASMSFLERAFGFTRGVVLTDTNGELRYAEMRHGSSVVMLVRTGDATTASGGVSALYAYVDDVDRQLARARDAGAVVKEAEDKPWGDRVASVIDPDGHRWILATFKKLAPFT
jgi:uncharacterized glyoxalase superfamily protein PhnB